MQCSTVLCSTLMYSISSSLKEGKFVSGAVVEEEKGGRADVVEY